MVEHIDLTIHHLPLDEDPEAVVGIVIVVVSVAEAVLEAEVLKRVDEAVLAQKMIAEKNLMTAEKNLMIAEKNLRKKLVIHEAGLHGVVHQKRKENVRI